MLQGLNAIAVLDAVTGTLVAAKTGSPLVVGFADTGNFVASDAEALLEHTRRVAFLDDGEAVVFTGTEARRRSLATGGDRPFEVTILDRAASSTDCGAFPDYMTKEIHEQPDVLARLALDASGAQELAKAIRDSEDVFAIGCGSGYHAALAAQYLFARSGKRVTAVLASEFGHVESFVRPGSLVIALSQSGETADVLTATRAARERGARVVAVTNAPGSSLSRAAGVVVPLGAGTERCVVSTKAFSAKLAVLLLAAHALGSDLQEGRRRVAAVAEELRAFLVGPAREAVRTIAGALVHRNHLFVIGRGTSYPLALEVALKIKEVSYLHAEAFAGGELKHGVIALIERGTPCIVLAPNDETRTDVLSAASQVRARGATVIGIACEPHATFDHFLPIGDFADATALVSSVPAQLLGYDLARLRGHDPDMPRNLAKSVTVR